MIPPSRILRVIVAALLTGSILLNAAWVAVRLADPLDFGSFLASGAAANRGDNPYGVYKGTFVVDFDGKAIDSPNLNPPITVYPFQLLAKVDATDAKTVMVVVSLLLYAGVLALLLREHPDKRTPLTLLWLFSLAGLWHILVLGQVYVFLLAAMAGAWLLQDKRPLAAGLLLGLLIAVKPNFLVWPALLFLAGDRRTSLAAVGAAAGISAIPLLLEGPTIYRQWLDAMSIYNGLEITGNSSLLAIASRIGLPWLGIGLSVALAGTLALWAYRTRPPLRDVAAASIVGALLLGPITWAGYALFALPVLLMRRWGGWEIAAAALLAAPHWLVLNLVLESDLTYVLLGSLYGWSLLILLGLLGRDAINAPRRPAVAESDLPQEPLGQLAA